ncbi:MAG: hypothetical protein V4719_07000 [Planctomycetota bacterium]
MTESALNTNLYWVAGQYVDDNGTKYVPASIVFIGNSFPYVTGESSSYGQNSAWTSDAGNPNNTPYQVNSSDTGAYFPMIPVVTLVKSTPTSAQAPTPTSSLHTFGGGVAIQAKTIDLNGTITVGEQSNWSVILTAALAQALSTYQAQYDQGQQTNPNYAIPQSDLATVGTNDNLITATYSTLTRQITLDNIAATLHGGIVSLNGGIISTNPMGRVQFNDGLGQVTIDNQTGLTVVVQQIDTGSNTLSQLSITDTQKPAATQQTVYTYQPDGNVQMYVGPAGAALSAMQLTTVTGSTASYAPQPGARWVWENTAQLMRTQNNPLSDDLYTKSPTISDNWISDWSFVDPSGPQMGKWALGTGQVQFTSGQEDIALLSTITSTATSSSLPVSIPATVPNRDQQYTNFGDLASFTPYQYQSNTHNYYNFDRTDDHHNYWAYYWPLSANLTQTNSLKADYSFGVDFAAGKHGGVNITSNAPIFLVGAVATGNASTTIVTTQGSIQASPGASITSASLTLDATGAVGTSSNPLSVSLTGGGTLNVAAGTNGIYLAVNSDAAIGTVISSDGNGHYGNVVLVGTGDFIPSATVEGFGGDGAGWATNSNGTTGPSIQANTLTLTDGNPSEATSAWLNGALPISNFSTNFIYTATANSTNSLADGAVFVLQNQGTSALGGDAGSLGYSGITSAVGYQINVYNGHTIGTNFVTTSTTGTYNATGEVNVASGNPILIQLSYNSSAQTVTETLTDTVTGATYTHTYTGLNLAAAVGGQTAYVGFTGGTGGGESTQTISNFEYHFTPSSTAPNIVGSNITIVSSAGGIGSSASPLAIQATGEAGANGGVVGGIVNASAHYGIYLVQSTGNLLVGHIESDVGDVSLSAPGGDILQGNTLADSGMTLADARILWQQLHLTDTLPGQQTVTAFENLIDSSYQQYWELISNGAVTNALTPVPPQSRMLWNDASSGTFTLSVGAFNQGTFWNSATSGTFTMTANVAGTNVTTGPISYNATASSIQAAWSLVGLSAKILGSGTQSDPWVITISEMDNFATNSNQLVGGTSATIYNPVWLTDPIAYNASARQVESALNKIPGVIASVIGTGIASNPWVISVGNLRSLASNDTGLSGGHNATLEVPSGALLLWQAASGGTYTLSGQNNGVPGTTPPLSLSASALTVQNALSSILGQSVQVFGAGTVDNPFIITGSNIETLTINTQNLTGGVQNVVVPAHSGMQRIWTTATGGSFRIAVNRSGVIDLTALISYHASAASVEAALNQLPGIQVSVSGSGTAIDPWVVSGLGSANIATTDDQLTNGVSLFQPVPPDSQQVWNNGAGGTFTLTISANGGTQTTPPIAYNITAAGLQNLLNQLPGVNVIVTGQGTSSSPWLISNPSIPLLSVGNSQLTGLTVQFASDGAVRLSNKAAGGTFTISVGVGGSTQTTLPLSYRATASEIAAALNQISGVQVTVTGSGTLTSPWVISGSGFTSLHTDDSQLAGGGSSTLSVPQGAQQVWSTATSGSFNLSLNINGTLTTTGDLPYNATAAMVQSALNALPGVQVKVMGNGTAESPWIIFGSIGSDLSTITTNNSNLAGALAGQNYVLDTSAFASYQQQASVALGVTNPTPQQIQIYVNILYRKIIGTLNATLPAGWLNQADFEEFNPAFEYTATPEQIAKLTAGALYTEGQLLAAIKLDALRAASGPAAPAVANIVGANVILSASGAIGQIAEPTFIPLDGIVNGTLTAKQIALISQLKNAGESRFVGVDSAGNTVKFSIGEEPAGVTITGIEVSISRPILLAMLNPAFGELTATAADDINVVQLNGDLHLNQVTSTSGAVQLTATGSILGTSVSGFGSNGTGWTLNNNGTAATISDDVLTLTDGGGSEARSAWLNTPVLTNSFVATFIYTGSANGGDGLAFVLQNDADGTAALGGSGGGLGYGNIAPSVAFEFNLYNGFTQGTNFVSNGTTGVYNTTGDVNVASGNPISVTLTYDAATSTITAMLTDTVTLATNTTTYSGFDIASILGSSTAILGFTAGDGGAVSTQTIRNFAFNGSYSIAAEQIQLNAGGSIGTANNLLLIDQTGTGSNTLNANAASGVYISSTGGDLNIGQVETVAGDIVLQANVPSQTQSIHLGSTSRVSAPQGNVTFLEANGDITFASGSVVTAGTNIILDPVSGSQFTLSGTLHAQLVQVIGGLGDDVVLLDLAGLNADLTFNGRDGQDRLVVNGTDNPTHYLINGRQLLVNSLRSITTDDVQSMEIHGGAGNDSFGVVGTLAGVVTKLFGGDGGDTFLIGSSSSAVRGTLDHILGAIQVYGGGSTGTLADEITIDDRAAVNAKGKALAAGYIVTPTQVIHDNSPGQSQRPTFAGITYDGTMEKLTLLGSDGINNYNVKPSQSTKYVLNGEQNTKHSGKLDTIRFDITGTLGARLKRTNATSGNLTFSSTHQAIQFTGMKQSKTTKLRAVARHQVIKKSGTADLEFTVVYRGLTAADVGALVDNNDAVRVTGPNGYSQLASFTGFSPSSNTGKLVVNYHVPAPNGLWTRNDTGTYKVEIIDNQIADTSGNTISEGVIGRLRVKVIRG